MRVTLFVLASLVISNSCFSQKHESGNAYVGSIPVSSCPAPATPSPNTGNPSGTITSKTLTFIYSSINSNSTNYRIQINKVNSTSTFDSENGFGCACSSKRKPSTLYEFTGSLTNQTSVTVNIDGNDLDGDGTYYYTFRQYVPGPPSSPCGGKAFGVSEYTTPKSFTISKPNLEPISSKNSCSRSGTTVSCSLAIKNNSVLNQTNIKVGFYLSKDATITTSDIKFDEVNLNSLLAGATSSTIGVSENIAGLGSAGTYNIGYIIDYPNDVAETSETDNVHRYSSCTVNMPISSIDAGITNPVNGLVIHRYNESTYIDQNGDLLVDGWSNTGKVSSIKLYNNSYLQGSVSSPSSGTWYDVVDVDPGSNEIYANVRCNYSGCPISGTNTAKHNITYVKPVGASNFYLTANDNTSTIKITWFKHTGSGTSNFHYRVYRNTIDKVNSGIDWTILGSWTKGTSYTDSPPKKGVKYYYWVVCATNSSGLYPSSFSSSRNEYLTGVINIYKDTVKFDKSVGYDTIRIKSNTSWQAQADSSWVTLLNSSANGNGVIDISVSANPRKVKRISKVTLTGLGVTKIFFIRQFGTGLTSANNLQITTDRYPCKQGDTLKIVKDVDFGIKGSISDTHLDSLGNLYASGSSLILGSTTYSNVVAAKFDSTGKLLWTSDVSGGTGMVYSRHQIKTDEKLNIYVALTYYSQAASNTSYTLNFGNNKTISSNTNRDEDVVVIKYNKNGKTLWAKKIDNAPTGYEPMAQLLVIGDGRSFIRSDCWGTNKTYVTGLDSSGAKAGELSFNSNSTTNSLYINDIQLDKKNHLILGGTIMKNYTFNSSYSFSTLGNIDAFVAKYDVSSSFSNADLVWVKKFGGNDNYSSGDLSESISCLTIGHNNCIYVTGQFAATMSFASQNLVAVPNTLSSIKWSDGFVGKLDKNGIEKWGNRLGGVWDDYGKYIMIHDDKRLLVTTYVNSSSTSFTYGSKNIKISQHSPVFAIDTLGNLESILDTSGLVVNLSRFERQFNNEVVVGLGEYRHIGYCDLNNTSQGSNRACNGWVEQPTGKSFVSAYATTHDDNGNLFTVGHYQGAGTFQGQTLANLDFNNFFISKQNKTGKLDWVKTIASNGNSRTSSIATDNQGNVYVFGEFQYKFNDGQNTFSESSSELALVKFNSSGIRQWTKIYGGSNHEFSSCMASDGTDVYIGFQYSTATSIGGYSFNSNGSRDLVFAKIYGSNGNVAWAKGVGGSSLDMVEGVSYLNKSIYFSGRFEGKVNFGGVNITSVGSSDFFLGKFDSKTGNVQWIKSGGSTSSEIYYNNLATNNGIYVVGNYWGKFTLNGTSTPFNSLGEGILVRYDLSGNVKWHRSFLSNNVCQVYAIDGNQNGDSIYVKGEFEDSLIVNSNTYYKAGKHSFIAQLDSTGILKNIAFYPHDNTGNYTYGNAVSYYKDTVYTVGYFSGSKKMNGKTLVSKGGINGFISQLVFEKTFNIAKTVCRSFTTTTNKTYTKSGTYYDTLTTVGGCDSIIVYELTINAIDTSLTKQGNTLTANDSTANYQWYNCDSNKIIGEETNRTFTTASEGSYSVIFSEGSCTDTSECYQMGQKSSKPEMCLDWAKSFGGSDDDYGAAVAFDDLGNVYITGGFQGVVDFDPGTGVQNLTSKGNRDVYIVKMDSNGQLIWAKSIGGTGLDISTEIVVDSKGNVHVSGYFYGTADLDPGTANLSKVSDGASDLYVVKLKPNGDLIWVQTIGGKLSDEAFSMTLDNKQNVYLTGNFGDTVDFDPGTGVAKIVSKGNADAFILKLDSSGNYISVKALQGTQSIRGVSIETDTTGAVFVSGFFSGSIDFDPSSKSQIIASSGKGDFFVLKLNKNGDLAWAKTIGDQYIDVVREMCIDANSNLYLTGDFEGTVDFNPGIGVDQLSSSSATISAAFVLKLDSAGKYQWARKFSTQNKAIVGLGIGVDNVNNVYAIGMLQDSVDFNPGKGIQYLKSKGSTDVFIVSLDQQGNFNQAVSFGGSGQDRGIATCLDNQSNLLIAGYFDGSADYDPGIDSTILESNGNTDIFFSKFSLNGCDLPTPQIESDSLCLNWAIPSGGKGNDLIHSISSDQFGNVYSTGIFSDTAIFNGIDSHQTLISNGLYDVFVEKVNKEGELLWAVSLGGSSSDWAYSITADSQQNSYITGRFYGKVDFDPSSNNYILNAINSMPQTFVLKLDKNGKFVWVHGFASTSNYDQGRSILHDGAGGLIISGIFSKTVDFDPSTNVSSLTSKGYSDIFILKLNDDGKFKWVKQIGSSKEDNVYSVAFDLSNNILVTGSYYGPTDFDPGTSVNNLTANGIADAFVLKLDTAGRFVWVKSIGGNGGDFGISINTDNLNNVLITGKFHDTVDFDPGIGSYHLVAKGKSDVFTLKLSDKGDFLWANRLGGNYDDVGYGVVADSLGNVYCTGDFQDTCYLGSGFDTLLSNGGRDVFLQKFNSTGKLQWTKSFGNIYTDQGTALHHGGNGQIYVGGRFNRTVDFDLNQSVYELTSVASSSDIFVLSLSEDACEKSSQINSVIYLKIEEINGLNSGDIMIDTIKLD